MDDLSQTLKKGTLLVVETGDYDRIWLGLVRMLITTTKAKLAKDYRREWKKPPDGWYDSPNPDGFLSWLIASGRAEAVKNVKAWHVGSHGRFKP